MDPTVVTVITGGAVVIGWLANHFTTKRNGGNGNGSVSSILAPIIETKTIVLGNTQLLQEMGRTQMQMATIISEIERRGRRSEEAIRRILENE